jgi:hypothetical protein
MQLPVLEVRAHNAAVEEWLNRVRFVPVEYLDECYQMAMDAHSTRTPLIPKEILAQWQIMSARPGFRDKPQFEEKRCPNYCSIAGWIVVNSEGVMQMDFGTSEYLYVKPCPIHRPQGAKIDPFAATGARVARLETTDQRSVGYNTGLPVEGFRSAGKVAAEQYEFAEDQ